MPLPDLSRLALRSLLSLPPPVLRALSGGAATYKAGRTLDPRLQFLSHYARAAAPEAPQAPVEVRVQVAASERDLAGTIEPGVQVETLTVPGPGGPLEARLYRPARGPATEALLLWLPSGGGVGPGLLRDEPLCSMLAALGGCVVLAVQPRPAPEHRFPAPLDDALAAWRWCSAEAARLRAPEGRLAVGGADFGGGLAAAVARTAEVKPVLQVLVTPWLEMASEAASMRVFADAWPLTAADVAWRAGQVLGAEGDPGDPRASPLKAPDVSGAPPAVVVTAGFDPLTDQGEAYARRLRQAGVPVAYRCFDALTHDFHVMTGVIPAADLACRETAALVRRQLQRTATAA
jgi:acetyl esterase